MDEEDINALRKAIEAFAFMHRRRPFGALREIAVQAELKRLADEFLWGRNFVNAIILDDPANALQTKVETDRVRLEAKIVLPGETENESDTRHDRTDLLLYRDVDVQLYRHDSGPGDIVYRTDPKSVLAAIEIKASPSNQLEQKKSYARDIRRLLTLRKNYKIAGFFVILDKSSPLYLLGQTPLRSLNPIRWAGLPGRCLTEIVYRKHLRAEQPEKWDDILISDEAPPSVPWVEIWDVSAASGQAMRFFAYFSVTS